jgi:hemoglobin-like flavoprotein
MDLDWGGDMNIERLRSSFELVVERDSLVIERFYEILFERHPAARGLFGRNSRKAQAAMLTSALSSVLEHIEDGVWLESTLAPLGAKHVVYGVTDEMYDWVGGSLLAALEEVAGDAWSPELAADWTEAYGAVAGLMKKGAATAAAAA